MYNIINFSQTSQIKKKNKKEGKATTCFKKHLQISQDIYGVIRK